MQPHVSAISKKQSPLSGPRPTSLSSPTPKSTLHPGPRPTLSYVPSSRLTKSCFSTLSPESKLWLRSIVWERSPSWCPTAIFFTPDSLSYRLLLVSFTCAECERSLVVDTTHVHICTRHTTHVCTPHIHIATVTKKFRELLTKCGGKNFLQIKFRE